MATRDYLSKKLKSKLTSEELELIDGITHGSTIELKQRANDMALSFIKERMRNPADGGDGGSIYIAGRKIIGNGKIISNGGNAALGGKPGNAGSITVISDYIEGNPKIEAKGGKQYLDMQIPFYKKGWFITLEVLAGLAAIVTILQFLGVSF